MTTFLFNVTSTPPSSVGSCRRRGRDCGLQHLLVVKDKNPKTSAALRSLREKKKGFPQRLERHRVKSGINLNRR